jgi:hypothetical protein
MSQLRRRDFLIAASALLRAVAPPVIYAMAYCITGIRPNGTKG